MSKYKSVRTEVDGIVFDSKREAARYSELCTLVRAGIISDLKLQQTYPLAINGMLVCTYRADFTYRDQQGRLIVEDVKGVRTRDYIIKAKLMEAIHGVRVLET